ncbi:hypothetical protein QTP86_033555 [Hemibagrus guttatus]|nr:hypothetical protein QTP86_033555 [Hemibagrus guttatus]
MTLGQSILNYSPSSSSCSSSSTSSCPGARGPMRKNRKFRNNNSDGVCVGGGDEGVTPACEDLLNALPGFLVAMTSEGKLLYVSENVSHYLGLSMVCNIRTFNSTHCSNVEVLQGDTFYSMITNNDTEKIKFFLQDENLNTERSCVCSFRTNRQSCPLLVRLRVLDPQKCLVVALCLPSLRERNSFTTTHTPDMKYTHTHYSVGLYLGYEAEELIGRSWYSIIHPDDLLLSARGHKQLMQCEQVDLVLRVQDKQLNWVWLYIIATRDTQSHMITCSNYIISEVVAEELRHELGTVSSVSSPPSQNSQCSTKRPAEMGFVMNPSIKVEYVCNSAPSQECEMYYYRYENAEVSCCYKYLMFSYNIIFWLAGAAFIAIGFWAWSEKGILLDLTQVTRLHGFDPVWLVLLVGMVTFILGFAGCVGALRENICLLRFFSGVIGFIFFLELTAAVLALVFQEPLRKWISDFFIVNVKGYRDDIDLQNLIDSLQRVNHCCGADSPNDWNQNAYFNCSRTNPSRERCGVPFSCCISDPADTVVNTQCGYDIRESEAAKWSSVIYVKGCVAALEEWLPRNIYIVAGVFIVISLLQMVGIFLARNLISDIEKVKFNY